MTTPLAAARLSSVLLAVAAGACGPGERPRENAKLPAGRAAVSPAPAASHEHEAPHGGMLVELGDEFAHVELVLDGASGRLTAFVLDGEAERSVRVSQPELAVQVRAAGREVRLVLKAVANPLTGESVGDSSEFAAEEPSLRGLAGLAGRLEAVSVRGTRFDDVPFGGKVD